MSGASGPNYVIPANPVYNNQIPSFADGDPIWATGVVNPVLLQIITNVEALRRSGGQVFQATIAASGWTKGAPNPDGTVWQEYKITDANVAAADVIIMLPANSDSAVQVAEFLRGYIATSAGAVTLYAKAVPVANFNVLYTINKGVV